ncbi:Uncharacterised protein [Mycobacteroides abscessus subsp. abscessus]|nr:Uncharacterised protein [Mycobacteroides abscessus subsp. abscessus]
MSTEATSTALRPGRGINARRLRSAPRSTAANTLTSGMPTIAA